MSLLGKTKGTELEKEIEDLMKLEAKGVTMYYALARICVEQGLDDLACELKKIAEDEAYHAGLYSVLNGHVKEDILPILKGISEMEAGGAELIVAFAKRVREMGLEEAAREIEKTAIDEEHHGKKLKELVKKYSKQ